MRADVGRYLMDHEVGAMARRGQFLVREEEEALLSWIVSSTDDWIWSVDAHEFGLLSFNESLRRYFLEARGIVIERGMRPQDLFPPDSPFIEQWLDFFRRARDEGRFATEYAVYAGTHILSLNLHRLERDGVVFGVSIFAKDITAERRAREKLEESETRFRTLSESALVGIDIIQDDRFAYVNPAIAEIFGYPPHELIGASPLILIHPDDRYRVVEQLALRISGQADTNHYCLRGVRKDGESLDIEVFSARTLLNNRPAIVNNILDVTQRNAAMAALERVQKALRVLSAGNEVLVHAGDELELLGRMVDIVVEMGGYAAAWVACEDTVADQALSIMREGCGAGQAGLEAGPGRIAVAEFKELAWDVLRSGQAHVRRKSLIDTEGQGEAGLEALLVLPLSAGGTSFGVLGVGSRDPAAFEQEEIGLFERLATDLAFGISSLRSVNERKNADQRLRNSLEAAIGVIAATVESRDPFTAGHQQRVRDLAGAIAKALGLSDEIVAGVEFGALIHDVGNVHVPAGILARPGRLCDAEFELIKTHPQIGFEIVLGIDFPWPVATMILQHHERLDGSGYPQGLKGDEILLEARILAVADVVEAMLSHRPYRPKLTLEAALQEITGKRGVRYDARVVDACVALFRDKGYSFTARFPEKRG